MTIQMQCCCGGITTANAEPDQRTATEECACGKIVFWSRDGNDPAPPGAWHANPPTLGLSVADNVKSHDKFGG